MKFLKPWYVPVLVCLSIFISCEQDTENLELENFSKELSLFMEDNSLTIDSQIVSDGEIIKVADIRDLSALRNVKNIINNAYSLTLDGDFMFAYDEATSTVENFEEIDHFAFNNIANYDKASNPIFWTLSIYKGENFRGQRFHFQLRSQRMRKINNGTGGHLDIRLNRFKNGTFNNQISSIRQRVTNEGVGFQKRTDLVYLAAFYRNGNLNNNSSFLGTVKIVPPGPGTNPRVVHIPFLNSINFAEQGYTGPGLYSNIRNWDNKISVISF